MRSVFLLLFTAVFLFSKDIVFGVVPQQSPSKLLKTWKPIVNYLSKETGLNVVFKTESSIPNFEKQLYSGKYDIAYMNPYHFVVAQKEAGYQAIVRSKKNIQGILVTPKSITKLEKEQMKGKNFLFPAPFAFAATLLTKYELKKKYGFDIEKEGKVLYVNSHDSVYKGVARGIGTYGGGIVRTYNKLKDEKTQGNIGILYKTEKYPSHPIGVKSSISKKDREKLRSALLKMPSEILKKLTNKDLKKIDSSEYDVIKSLARELGIY